MSAGRGDPRTAESAEKAGEKMKRDYEWYDLSRYRSELYGISILWIMLFHFKGTYPLWAKAVLSFGNMGVELFLFASGVSLYFTMQKKESLSVYYGRRLLRLTLPVVLICSWQFVPAFLKGKLTVPALVTRWTSLHFWFTGKQQTWFVSFLLAAYLLYPYFHAFLFKEGGNLFLRTSVLVAGSLLFNVLLKDSAPKYYDLTSIALTRFPIFILGCAAGRAVHERKTVRGGKPWMMPCLAAVAAASFAVMGLKLVVDPARRYFYVIPAVALSLFLPAFFSLLDTGNPAAEALRKALRYMGDRSLELYLLHIMLANHLLKNKPWFDRTDVKQYYLMLAACLVMAWPAHFILEKLRAVLSPSGGGKPGRQGEAAEAEAE